MFSTFVASQRTNAGGNQKMTIREKIGSFLKTSIDNDFHKLLVVSPLNRILSKDIIHGDLIGSRLKKRIVNELCEANAHFHKQTLTVLERPTESNKKLLSELGFLKTALYNIIYK